MKHPYIWGAAATAALFAAVMVANAQLDKWANETLDGVARCYRCGRAVWAGYVTDHGDVYCHDCGRGMPEEWWVEE